MRKLLKKLRMPPDCREVAKVLQSFLDGELPADQTHLVAGHVEHCDRCGLEADLYERVKDALGQLRTPPDREAVSRLRAFADELATEVE